MNFSIFWVSQQVMQENPFTFFFLNTIVRCILSKLSITQIGYS